MRHCSGTHQFSYVDMEEYLTPLVNQIVNSYSSAQSVRTIIEASECFPQSYPGDTSRIRSSDELVTNSLKHAFPREVIACQADQAEACPIWIRLTKMDGSYQLDCQR